MQIDIERVTFSYERAPRDDTGPALDGLDLAVPSGEVVTLLGPSGSGKTTLLAVVAGFLEPRSGAVRFDDRVVSCSTFCLPPRERQVGMVFQDLGLWPHLTVDAHLDFVLRCRKVPRAERRLRRAEMLEALELTPLKRKRPAQISGGEAQRLALGRALVARPSILLLDEPLGALDTRLRAKLLEHIQSLQERFRPTTLHVTHDHREAASSQGRVAVLDAGRVVQVGRPEEVYRTPVSEVVARLTGEVNVFEATPGGDNTVYTPFGAYRTAFHTSPEKRFRLLVRPEQVRLEPAPDGDARVCARTFEEGRWKLRATTGELELVAISERDLAIGERVHVNLGEPVWGVPE